MEEESENALMMKRRIDEQRHKCEINIENISGMLTNRIYGIIYQEFHQI